jgi:hypothetical protein
MLMVIDYGKGRVFHTVLGHDLKAMSGVAFQVTLQRGTEWAATGQVNQPPVSDSQLTADEPATRDPESLKRPEANSTKASINSSPRKFDLDFDLPPDSKVEGWISLFNGTDLKGWVQRNGTAIYTVETACILGKTSVGSPNSFLCTEEDYGDFELSFEVNVDLGLNSGVQIRSRSLQEFNDGRVHGPQIEIESSPGEAGYLYSEATGRNWISKTQPVHELVRNGEWNRFLIRAAGPRIQTWINGTKIEDLIDPESFAKGFIGLQVHSIPKEEGPFQVRWRDIKLRPL